MKIFKCLKCGKIIVILKNSAEHYIEWILLETNRGYNLVNLKPGEKPEVKFNITDDEKVERAYAYCNLHGLWKKDM